MTEAGMGGTGGAGGTGTGANAGQRGPSAISIVRVFDAPREMVFQQWVESEAVADWFAPDGFTVTNSQVDARPGGQWGVTFRSESGEEHHERGEFREVVAPERLVFTLTQEDAKGRQGPETVVSVQFAVHGSAGAQTEMRFHQSGFTSVTMRDGNSEGWTECFAKLERRLVSSAELPVSSGRMSGASDVEPVREIQALFDAWFRASAAKDLDASMAPIARDVVSYEHEVPLQYHGIDAVRAVCQRGFEAMSGEVRWDIPDLRIVVRGDLAVTWGLNQVRGQEAGGAPVENWSRGTRVFLKSGGEWKMIHQHVSFPYDPETGEARMDAAR